MAGDHSPATVIFPTRIDPVRMDERGSTSVPIARMFANVQGGQLGRYMLVTVLGIAAILLLTLAGTSAGMTR